MSNNSESQLPDESHDPLTLSPKDAAAIDALLEAGGGARLHLAREADEQSRRAARVAAWLKVLGAAPTPVAPADLAQRTLDAVAQDRMKLHPQPAARPTGGGAERSIAPAEARRPRSRKVAEIAAMFIAAMLLVAVIIPATSAARRSAKRVACSANLTGVSRGFEVYGAAYNHELPSIAMPENRNWLHGNTPDAARTNTAHLLPLLRGNYLHQANLICPGKAANPSAAPATELASDLPDVGYSYVNLYGYKPSWDGANSTLILADNNPLFASTLAGQPDANSPNHGGQGSYVVHADGQVSWETQPNIGPGHDNIWSLGSGAQRAGPYSGIEVPTSSSDIFIAP